jgi:hypothetical protein
MTYQDLIEELKSYSPEELKQPVKFMYLDHGYVEEGDTCSAEDVNDITVYDGDEIYILA